jgi:hypothetical protein
MLSVTLCFKLSFSFFRNADNSSSVLPVHEFFGYSPAHLQNNKLNAEFHFLPTEIVEVINALKQIANNDEQKRFFAEIQPDTFFKSVIVNKNDIKQYEKFLLEKLHLCSKSSLFSNEELLKFFEILNGACEDAFDKLDQAYGIGLSTEEWAESHIYDLVDTLHKKQMLPAIVFCKTVNTCNQLAKELTEHLQSLELARKKSYQSEKDTIKMERKLEKRAKEAKRRLKSLQKMKHPDACDEATLNEELEEIDNYRQFIYEMDNIDEDFSFLDFKYKATSAELEEEIQLHKHRNIPKVNLLVFQEKSLA